jgi:chloride channel protein, CIC family
VLAPTFMIGATLGALEGHVLPGVTPGFWALVGLAACVGGVIRAPLTGVVFPLELTHEWRLLVPCLIGSASAYVVSVLALRRSVLTERLARRGFHVSQEYAVDPLELLLVAEVMRPPEPIPAPLTVRSDQTLRQVAGEMARTGQLSANVRDPDGSEVLGAIAVEDLLRARARELQWEHDRERVLRPRLRTPGRAVVEEV